MKLKNRDFILYGAALLSAILAVAIVYGYVQNRIAEAEQKAKAQVKVKTITVVEKPKMRSVVVAAHDIFRGERIGVDDVKVLAVPTEGVIAKGVVVNPQDVVGRVANQNIYAGEWIIDRKIGGYETEKKSIEAILAPGQRAIRIPVSAETGLLGILNPNDRVDVVSVFPGGGKTVSRTIMQNIEVLSVGQYNRMGILSFSKDQTQASAQNKTAHNKNSKSPKSSEDEAFIKSSMVALNVNTKQAEMLALAMNIGAIHLVLRNPADVKIVKTTGVNAKILSKGGDAIKYRIKKRKREVIELMQGNKVQEVRIR
ncbi:Flp pilus assembly protein CpaB [Galenea microaerophila]